MVACRFCKIAVIGWRGKDVGTTDTAQSSQLQQANWRFVSTKGQIFSVSLCDEELEKLPPVGVFSVSAS